MPSKSGFSFAAPAQIEQLVIVLPLDAGPLTMATGKSKVGVARILNSRRKVLFSSSFF